MHVTELEDRRTVPMICRALLNSNRHQAAWLLHCMNRYCLESLYKIQLRPHSLYSVRLLDRFGTCVLPAAER